MLFNHTAEGLEELGVVFGKRASGNPGGEGGRAFFSHFLGRRQDLAVLLQFGQCRVPNEASVNVAAVVDGHDFRLGNGKHLHVFFSQALALDQRQQLVVVGRDRCRSQLLALDVGNCVDA